MAISTRTVVFLGFFIVCLTGDLLGKANGEETTVDDKAVVKEILDLGKKIEDHDEKGALKDLTHITSMTQSKIKEDIKGLEKEIETGRKEEKDVSQLIASKEKLETLLSYIESEISPQNLVTMGDATVSQLEDTATHILEVARHGTPEELAQAVEQSKALLEVAPMYKTLSLSSMIMPPQLQIAIEYKVVASGQPRTKETIIAHGCPPEKADEMLKNTVMADVARVAFQRGLPIEMITSTLDSIMEPAA